MIAENFAELVQGSLLLGFPLVTPVTFAIFLFQSTLFLALVLLVDWALRKTVASVRKFIWFWAIMMLPIVTVLANLTPATKADQYLEAALEQPFAQSLLSGGESTLGSAGGVDRNSAQTVKYDNLESSGAGQAGKAARQVGRSDSWVWLVYAYAVVSLLLLARIPVGLRQLKRLRANSTEALDQRSVRAYAKVAAQISYAGSCQVRLTRDLESPVSFGIRKPIIMFPSRYYSRLSDTELSAALSHELSHIKHRDPLRVLLTKVIESLFFFQPLVWLASSRLHYLSELVADDSVLETGLGPSTYAASLVNMIELGSAQRHQSSLATGIFSTPRILVSRVEHLLDDNHDHISVLVGRRLVASALVLVAVFIVTVQFSPRSSALVNASARGQPVSDLALNIASAKSPFMALNTEQTEFSIKVDRVEVVSGETVTLTVGAQRYRDLELGVLAALNLSTDFDASVLRADVNPDRYVDSNGLIQRAWAELDVSLLPLREGVLTIPSFEIGSQRTQSFEIEVSSAEHVPLAQNGEALFLTLEVSEKSVAVNEEIELSIRLFYTINGIRNPQFSELLLPNSVVQAIDQPKQYEERIDGVLYGVYHKRYVLTPQSSGPLEIPDIQFKGEVNEGGSVVREITASIEGLEINVTSP